MTDAAVDLDALQAAVSAAIDEPVGDLEVLNDGLNFVAAVSTPDAGWAYTLRSRRSLAGASYIIPLEREHAVLIRLADTPVPAPTPVAYREDGSPLEAPFLISEYVEGEVVNLGSDLPERYRTERSRRVFAEGVVDALAALHDVPTGPFEGLCEHHSPLEQVERSAERLDAAEAELGRTFPTVRAVEDWLRKHAPDESPTAVVHGDFRPGNILFAGEEPRVVGVLDWETTMLGDPLTELGYLLLRWRDPGDPAPDVDAIAEQYPDSESIAQLRRRNEAGLAPYTADPGSPTRRELVERYEDRTGLTFEHDRFYRAHGTFMLATVWVDLHRKTVAAGAESDWDPHIEYMARLGKLICDGKLGL